MDEALLPDGLVGGLMVCGTGSEVGKSALVTGICRLLSRHGVSVAPFKGQNMSLNSWVTRDGAEIGRAQGVQALAAGAEPEAAMNPILLKPTGDRTSQVIVMGKPWAHLDAVEYRDARRELAPVVLRALGDLRARFDVVICEGAGSPSEINLLDGDLVNLGIAHAAGLPALVVGDIDRGGVLASLYGTVALLPDHLREMVRAFVINKFRGDPEILAPGLEELERRSGVPTIGVVPWVGGLGLDAEDSLALQGGQDLAPDRSASRCAGVDVAVVRFPRLSNFTDLDALGIEPAASVRMVESPGALGDPDLVVLPGTKTTIEDLDWLRRTGLAAAIAERSRRPGGAVVLGICGGYQMLGTRIVDMVESTRGEVAGLGWLGVETVFDVEKTVCRRIGAAVGPAAGPLAGEEVEGYEIHHGRTRLIGGAPGEAWLELRSTTTSGGCSEMEGAADLAGAVFGTSLHGLLESDGIRRALLRLVARHRGRDLTATPGDASFAAARVGRLDALADLVGDHLDTRALGELISEGGETNARHYTGAVGQ